MNWVDAQLVLTSIAALLSILAGIPAYYLWTRLGARGSRRETG